MSEKLGKPIWDSALNFWFHELTPKQWFVSSSQLDQTISDRFSGALQALASVQSTDDVNDDYLSSLTINSALDTLGAILITDQFSRNIYRGSAKAFATDNFALSLSNYLINHDHLPAMETQQVQFAVMPQMHAEDLEAQRLCVDLFKRFGVEQGVKSAIEHLNIIQQFGRFPHRNDVLGRRSTADEIEYLKDGKSFGQS